MDQNGEKALMNPSHLSTCWLKVCFCSSETREDGKPGERRASLSHTVSRAKQCLFRQKSTSANWSIRLRDDWPPMAWWKNRFIWHYSIIMYCVPLMKSCTLTSSTASRRSLPSSCTTWPTEGMSAQCGINSVCSQHETQNQLNIAHDCCL